MMKSGVFDINNIEIEKGQKVLTNSVAYKSMEVTFEDGAFCLRIPGTIKFTQAVTIRDAMVQAKKQGINLEIEVVE